MLWPQGGRCPSWWQYPNSLVVTGSKRDVKLKQLHLVYLADGSLDAADRYWQAERNAATLVVETKAQDWTSSKRFWTTIPHPRRGKQCAVNTVYSGDGVLVTSTQNFLDR